MSLRPTLEQCFMKIAEVMSNRSTCSRLHVGCVITNEDMTSVDAIGYNGNYKGGPNVNDSDEKGKTGNIHAEVNALIKSNYNIKNKKMFITHSPCIECTKLIINHGIKEVYFKVLYRDMAPIQLLLKADIKVFQQKNKTFKEILK